MPPCIAILGWGSLLWEGGADFDRWHDDWRFDGPSLNLEFSRVSSSRLGALTLVIDPKHGSSTTVAWCLSKRPDPSDALADLRCREGCLIKSITRLDVQTATSSPQDAAISEIASWAKAHRIDVVIWTALKPNFEDRVKRPFSVDEAIAYLQNLEIPAKVKAAEYVWRAPYFVRTNLRSALETEPWFSQVRPANPDHS